MEHQEILFNHILSGDKESTDYFSIYRFYHLLETEPVATLEELFLNYYWRGHKVEYEVLKQFLTDHAAQIYPGIIKFAVPLERSYLYACFERDFFSKQATFLNTLRNLIKHLLQHLLDNTQVNGVNIEKVLRNMRHGDEIAQQVKENFRIPFDCILALDNLPEHLKGAEHLADLSVFRCAYFSAEAIGSCPSIINNFQYTAFMQRQIQHLITKEKKEQIRQVLKTIIENGTVPQQAKQAFALYVTLKDDSPWHKHPFIQRLFYNSYCHWLATGVLTVSDGLKV